MSQILGSLLPELAQFSLFAGRSRCPENLVRGCGLVGGAGRCRLVVLLARQGVLIWPLRGGPGWEEGRGLPVTSSARGMRARKLAWRGKLDLRVASCCLRARRSVFAAFEPVDRGSPGVPRAARLVSRVTGQEGPVGHARARRIPAQLVEDEDYQLRYERVAGIDVAKAKADVCTRLPAARGGGRRSSRVEAVGAIAKEVLALAGQAARGRG
jgi:hypothetical protein